MAFEAGYGAYDCPMYGGYGGYGGFGWSWIWIVSIALIALVAALVTYIIVKRQQDAKHAGHKHAHKSKER